MALLLRFGLLFAVVLHATVAYPGRPYDCYKITRKTMPLCANLTNGYEKMMLPNSLHHSTLKEVRQELSQWYPLVNLGCHKLLKVFLCSVFAPVCVRDRIGVSVPPCQSLCTVVRTSCEPVMKRYNYSWPIMLNCSKYPENNMCVKIEGKTKPARPTVCSNEGGKMNLEEAQRKVCEAKFALKGRIIENKTFTKGGNKIIILKFTVFKVIKGIPMRKRSQVRMRLPLASSSDCSNLFKRNQLLIVGTYKKGGRRMVVTSIMKWKKKAKKLKQTASMCKKH